MSGPGLEVTSGIGTVSGVAAVNALPVTLYGASGNVISDFSGAINVNISGANLRVAISGQTAGMSGLNVISAGVFEAIIVDGASIAGNQTGLFQSAFNAIALDSSQGQSISPGGAQRTFSAIKATLNSGFSNGTYDVHLPLGIGFRDITPFSQIILTAKTDTSGVLLSTVETDASNNWRSQSNSHLTTSYQNFTQALSTGGANGGAGGFDAKNVVLIGYNATVSGLTPATSGQVNIYIAWTTLLPGPNTSYIINLSGIFITVISGQSLPVSSGGVLPVSLLSGSIGSLSGLIVGISGQVVRIASSGGIPISDFSGALNVNISGGTISTTPPGFQSGTEVVLSGGFAGISGLPVSVSGDLISFASGATGNLSGLNVIASVTSTIPAYQSGTLVGISGGSVGISGTAVTLSGIFSLSNISGGVTVSGNITALSGSKVSLVSASGNIISDFSGALNVNISGGSIAVNPFGYQSGTLVGISGGSVGLSGLIGVSISGSVTVLGHVISGLVVISGYAQIAGSGTTPFIALSGNVMTSGGSATSGQVNISGAWLQPVVLVGYDYSGLSYIPIAVTTSGSSELDIAESIQVSGTVGVSGIVQIGSGSVAVLSGAISIQSGIISISGGVSVSGTVGVSGIVQIGSGSIAVLSGSITINSGNVYLTSGAVNAISGLVSMFEWPSYTMQVFWSGPAGIGIAGLANAGGAAAQSGKIIELIRIETGIWASGNINRLDLYRVNDTTVIMSGPAGTIVSYFSGNSLSLASGFIISSSGVVSGASSGISAMKTLFLEANSSGYVHKYVYEFSPNRMQQVQVVSGQGLIAIMTSGIGIGMLSFEWIERYIS